MPSLQILGNELSLLIIFASPDNLAQSLQALAGCATLFGTNKVLFKFGRVNLNAFFL